MLVPGKMILNMYKTLQNVLHGEELQICEWCAKSPGSPPHHETRLAGEGACSMSVFLFLFRHKLFRLHRSACISDPANDISRNLCAKLADTVPHNSSSTSTHSADYM